MGDRKASVPLAWLQLSYDRRRLAAAVAGIVFAVALMLIQMGFRDALYLAAVHVHKEWNGELFLLSKDYQYLAAARSFSQRMLYDTLGVPEVKSVVPVYLGLAFWKNPETLRELSIFTIGYDPKAEATLLPGMSNLQAKMALPETVLFDAGSKYYFGPVASMLKSRGKLQTEVSGRRVDVAGVFNLGVSFACDGNMITSEANFLRLLPYRQEGLIDLGIIQLRPGADVARARTALLARLPPGLQVLTKQAYMDYEKGYWATRTPIGFVFNLGVLVGFVVGAVIVYQILYSDVMDHLSEYATLKAMGYSNWYLNGVVLRQALMLCVVGYIPGWIISTGAAIVTHKVTLIPCLMTWERTVVVFVLTLAMCSASALLAVRKLKAADPAEIF